MSKKRIIIIAVAAVIIIAAFFGIRAFNQSKNAAAEGLLTETAKIGSLEAFVGGTGTVHSNQNATLTWQTSGTVESVLAGLGDQVAAGDILAELYTSSLSQAVILARADLVSAQDALEDFHDSFGPLAIALAEQKVANARDAVSDTEEELDGIYYTGTDDEIEDAREAFWDAQDKLDQIADQFSETSYQYRQMYQTYASALAHYNYVSGNTVDDIKEAQYQSAFDVAIQQLAEAEAEYNRLLTGPRADEIAAAEARVAAAQATLQLAWVEAPFAGTVTIADPLPGDQVTAGTMAFQIDDLTHLLVDVEISEVDINRVAVGQQAELSFDAILAMEFAGEVVEVSPVGTSVQGLVNFLVSVELTDPDELIKPGMTAAVNIRVEELEDVLLVPNRAVRVVDGERVVYVLTDDGSIEMVKIELGANSDLHSEVIGGELGAGDEIILNPTTSFFDSMENNHRGPFGGN
ncbi:MAG: efflux RND transporter periplasmic adaptor subunit [Chloroflexota bacterium]